MVFLVLQTGEKSQDARRADGRAIMRATQSKAEYCIRLSPCGHIDDHGAPVTQALTVPHTPNSYELGQEAVKELIWLVKRLVKELRQCGELTQGLPGPQGTHWLPPVLSKVFPMPQISSSLFGVANRKVHDAGQRGGVGQRAGVERRFFFFLAEAGRATTANSAPAAPLMRFARPIMTASARRKAQGQRSMAHPLTTWVGFRRRKRQTTCPSHPILGA